ncbi:MAG: hypothetical protein A3G43_14205 [Ignavibacteria bacterium RIFCSPLOWO2_12_FULL_56_21]|nr:MAG: hypothetical protein A3G43_14205 [Ignavibacteria bacterium RIFCSPLOWO2_12_FULL_56_21]
MPLPVGLTWHDWHFAPVLLANFGSARLTEMQASMSTNRKYERICFSMKFFLFLNVRAAR